MAGGALVNALAFSGTNYLFGMLGGAERKRHDLAMEKLSKARGEYSRKSHQRLDFINQSLQQQRHATQTFSNLDVAMRKIARTRASKAFWLLRTEPSSKRRWNCLHYRRNGTRRNCCVQIRLNKWVFEVGCDTKITPRRPTTTAKLCTFRRLGAFVELAEKFRCLSSSVELLNGGF